MFKVSRSSVSTLKLWMCQHGQHGEHSWRSQGPRRIELPRARWPSSSSRCFELQSRLLSRFFAFGSRPLLCWQWTDEGQMNLAACYWANSMGQSGRTVTRVCHDLSGPQDYQRQNQERFQSLKHMYFNFCGESAPRIGLPQYVPCHAPSKVEWNALTTDPSVLCCFSAGRSA